MMVVSPQADEEGMSAALDRVNRYVSEHGGSLVRQEQWGRLRRLAYPIRNFNEGNYVLSYLELDPQDTRELEAGLMLSEDVLRHLLVKVEAIPPAPAPRVEQPEAAVATAEAAAATAEAPVEPTETDAAASETSSDPTEQPPEAEVDASQPEGAAQLSEPAAEAESPNVATENAAELAEEPPAEEPASGEAPSGENAEAR
jgi:small subunit ribosomal protein S6